MERTKYERYTRQIIIPRFGTSGQENLDRASVLVVGCGGLGCTIIQILARAGLGKLVLCDEDRVQLTDLHRQVCYDESHIGEYKAQAAAKMLGKINSQVTIAWHVAKVNRQNIDKFADGVDLVIDATDNLATRNVINHYAVEAEKDWLYGGCREFAGTVMLVRPTAGACLSCVFGNIDEANSAEPPGPIPIIGSLPVLVGALQANEVIRYFAWPDRRDAASKLITVDLTVPRVNTMKGLKKNPECRLCNPSV
jgi:adenylyltransferase/sulfurtransferase